MGTLANEAGIGVWVQAPKVLLRGSGGISPGKILWLYICIILHSVGFLSFSGRRCPCLERITAPRHVCSVPAGFLQSSELCIFGPKYGSQCRPYVAFLNALTMGAASPRVPLKMAPASSPFLQSCPSFPLLYILAPPLRMLSFRQPRYGVWGSYALTLTPADPTTKFLRGSGPPESQFWIRRLPGRISDESAVIGQAWM